VPTLHLHDLRQTGNTLAAQSGASLRDLMALMGHDSPAAALIYQHSSRASDEAIAAAVDTRLAARLKALSVSLETALGPIWGPERAARQPAMPASMRWLGRYVERMTGIEPALSAWEAAEPSRQRVLHAQRTSFEDQFCDVSAGVGARGGPEKLIKMATDQLD
jgi:hypothetical protein